MCRAATLMLDLPLQSSVCRMFSPPQSGRRVLGAGLNCSESKRAAACLSQRLFRWQLVRAFRPFVFDTALIWSVIAVTSISSMYLCSRRRSAGGS